MPHTKPYISPQSRAYQEASPSCPYCQRRFISLDEMTLHIVTRHTRTAKLSIPPAPATSAK